MEPGNLYMRQTTQGAHSTQPFAQESSTACIRTPDPIHRSTRMNALCEEMGLNTHTTQHKYLTTVILSSIVKNSAIKLH